MRLPLCSSLLLLPLAACMAGPDYKGPASAGAAAAPDHFARGANAAGTGALTVADWWTAMGDPTLDALEARALDANPDIAVAEARVRQARASLRTERANRLPSGNASAVYLHAQIPDLGGSDSGDGGSQSFDIFNLGFDASWEVDLWGGKRRSAEAARAQLEAAEADRSDAQVSLTAEVAQAYANLRDRQIRVRLGEEDNARQKERLALIQQLRSRGAASALDVEQQRDRFEQSSSALLPITAERDAYLNALAVLTGQAPGALDAMLSGEGAVPLPPAEVSVGDPASLLQRRPDVRAAERRYAAATAKIGVADAARFPKLSFMGLIGLGGSGIGDVVDPETLFGLAAPQLSWNFLDFGRNAARVEQAKGAGDEAAARYRAAVLGALRDCEDALSRYGARRQAVASAGRSLASAERNLKLVRQRFDAGAATRIDLLDADRRRIAARQSLSQATAMMMADFVSLQKALGLGWR